MPNPVTYAVPGTPPVETVREPGMEELPNGLQWIKDLIQVGARMMPNIMVPPDKIRGRSPFIVEDPQAVYPNALLPCVDIRFLLRFTNDVVNSVLRLTIATVQAIQLFGAGTGDIGTPVGIWWTLGEGDTTLQQNGAFVYLGHTFWAWGHTISYEGCFYRGGEGASAIDPIVKDRNLQDGFGSYAEQILEAVATHVGIVMRTQGSECPQFLSNFAFNGDTSQLKGGGLLAISDASLPFKPWERALRIGSRDSFNKVFATFRMSTDIEVRYIGGNPPTGDVFASFRMRVCGGRECGDVVPGCG